MADMMEFPASVEEFMEQYKMTDTEHVYSNGTEFVPIYRMRQWFDHVNKNGSSVVRHGIWNESVSFDDGFWVCSECGFVSEATAAPQLYHYCPNCGADMREKEGE